MLALLLALQAPLATLALDQDTLPRVTLTEALQRAARLDPNYVQALGQVDNAAWARRNAFTAFVLPSVAIGANLQKTNPAQFFFTNKIIQVDQTWTAQLIARYDVFTGGQKFAEL